MTSNPPLRHLLQTARARLVDAGIDANEAAMDASLLARHVLGWDMARLIAHELDPPPDSFLTAFEPLVARRVAREPVSSLIGRREFWGLEFEIGPNVLAPRPETEIIIEQALATLKGRPTREATLKGRPTREVTLKGRPTREATLKGRPTREATLKGRPTREATLKGRPTREATLKGRPTREATLKGRPTREVTLKGCPTGTTSVGRGFSLAEQPLFVDVGTGSGCLAICLAREFPDARVIATDVSPAALAIAERNARRLEVGGRIEFVRTSLLDGVSGPAALIVSNPPYIPAADIERLAPEVRDWEPRQALDGGPDGLDLIRALLAAVPSVLAPGGWFIMELGFGQEKAVETLVRESPLELARIVNDLQQIPRTLVAKAAGSR
jgi:release factor glutamine methyltransferase